MRPPNQALLDILLDAYRPCSNFGVCSEAQWNPAKGQMPRGFLGATGDVSEVEVVVVFAEPGHPHPDENYNPALSSKELLTEGLKNTHECFATGVDLFHRNTRWFMSELYPDLSFDDQLRRVWLTEGRLCSIDNEIGWVGGRTCAIHYLSPQANLLTQATFVAFGGKAQRYLKGLKIAHIPAFALAPPGANHRPAKPSWLVAIDQIKAKREYR